MLNYKISAFVTPIGQAKALVKDSEIKFDASSEDIFNLPNPAELLLTSLAACILKNVQRYSEKLKISYSKATITVNGERNDNPPFMKKIDYLLEIETHENERKLHNLHKNIVKFGTITNTLLRALELNGEIKKISTLEE